MASGREGVLHAEPSFSSNVDRNASDQWRDAQPAPSGNQPTTVRTIQIDMDVRPNKLRWVQADDGNLYLVYNLFITNWSDFDLTLTALDIEDATTGALLLRYDAKALEDPFRQRSTRLVASQASPTNRVLRSGRTAIMTVGVPFDPTKSKPSRIQHRLRFAERPDLRVILDSGSYSIELTSLSATTSVETSRPLVIGNPLRGGPWRCANGLGYGNGHSAIYASRTARLRVPQRFGCDFFKVDSGGNVLPSPFPDLIAADMFYGCGESVIAVADATVASTRNDIPEGVPQADGSEKMPVPLTEATISGNVVVLELGDGRFAFYAHLQPGSLRVRPGQRVRKGQILAKLGMSGSAVGPHLHFQISDRPQLNGGEAVPFEYESYTFAGRGKPDPSARKTIKRAIPLDNSIMIFEDREIKQREP